MGSRQNKGTRVQIFNLTCVNWGNVPTGEYPFGAVTLLTGGSGTGKTTMADAIQSVMTAVKRSLYTFNPSQDETTQQGRHGKTPRTLASYILGCDDNVYARPNGAYGYVSLVFAPSPGEPTGKVFSAILAVRAYLETVPLAGGRRRRTAREDDLKLLIVDGHGVGLNDLVEAHDGQDLRAVPTESVLTVLRQRYGDAAVADFGDNKRSYLCKLYGLLRGRPSVSPDEAEKAARTFARFMAYKPIESIHQFVRDQVLEPRDMDEQINTIAGLMRRMHELRSESERLSRNVELLSHTEREGDSVRASWREACEAAVRRPFKVAHDAQTALEKTHDAIKAVNLEQTRLSRREEEIERLVREHRNEFNDVQASLRQNEVIRERDSTREKIGEESKNAAGALAALNTALAGSAKNFEIAEQLKRLPARLRSHEQLSRPLQQADLAAQELRLLDVMAIGDLVSQIARTAGDPPVSLLERLAGSVAGIDDGHELFASVINEPDIGLRAQSEQVYALVKVDLQKLVQDEEEVRKDIEELDRGQRVRYPHDVESALVAIHRDLPGAEPVILCDLIDIRDKEWQPALEAYIGNNRFVIIVKPGHEARAIRLVRSLNLSGAKVVQGERATRDAERLSVPGDSVIHLLDVQHTTAKAYLIVVYGPVVRVKDTEQLRHTPRGLTRDGHGSAGYAMFSCWLADDFLVIGKSGRELQLKAKRRKLEELRVKRSALESHRGDIDQVRRLCQGVHAIQVERHVAAALTAARLIATLRERLERMVLTQDVKDLETRRDALVDQITQFEDESKENLTRIGELNSEAKGLNSKIDELENERAAAEANAASAIDDLQRLGQTERDYDFSAAVARLREEATSPALTRKIVEDNIGRAIHGAQTALGKFLKHIREYNPKARADEQIQYQAVLDIEQFSGWNEFLPFAEAYQQVKVQLLRQRENRLSEVTGELQRAERDVRNAFTAQFCQLVHDAVLSGDRYLRALNESLHRHRFSEEIYRFTHEWVPEFERYFDFFEAVVRSEQAGEEQDLFGSTKFTPQQVAVRDELHALLLGNEEQRAHNKLLEIADYRNYRRYDILRDTGHGDPTPLSEWGQGSGGQLQTAAYVIRATAVASAYRLSDGDFHLRTMLLDESFSTMDERRAKEVIAMLARTMGFQVIFVIPSRASGPFMPLATHKLVFSKVRSAAAPGELKTVSYIDQQVINQEEVERLWEVQRQRVRAQTIESFRQKRANERGLA